MSLFNDTQTKAQALAALNTLPTDIGLPVFTHVNGGSATPASGTFTTNADTFNGTTTIHMSSNYKDGDDNFGRNFAYLGYGVMVFSGVGSDIIGWIVTAIAGVTDDVITLTGHFGYSYAGDWSGDYAISMMPGVVNLSIDQVLNTSGINPVADGTYTVGIGGSTNGTITIASGVITAVQEAS